MGIAVLECERLLLGLVTNAPRRGELVLLRLVARGTCYKPHDFLGNFNGSKFVVAVLDARGSFTALIFNCRFSTNNGLVFDEDRAVNCHVLGVLCEGAA